MSSKSDFSADEWKLLLESVMMSGIAVTAADPHGLWATLKESIAATRALDQGKTGSSELVKALSTELETAQGRSIVRDGLTEELSGSKAWELKAKSVDVLRRAAELLDSKAPDDATAVKLWLRQISRSAAEASKEGGFLGFGGVQISDAEKATLSEIDGVLGLPPAA